MLRWSGRVLPFGTTDSAKLVSVSNLPSQSLCIDLGIKDQAHQTAISARGSLEQRIRLIKEGLIFDRQQRTAELGRCRLLLGLALLKDFCNSADCYTRMTFTESSHSQQETIFERLTSHTRPS